MNAEPFQGDSEYLVVIAEPEDGTPPKYRLEVRRVRNAVCGEDRGGVVLQGFRSRGERSVNSPTTSQRRTIILLAAGILLGIGGILLIVGKLLT